MAYFFKKKIKKNFFDYINLLICKYNEKINTNLKFDRKKRIAIFANDPIGNQINQFGYYEKDELDLLFSFFENCGISFINKIALDIGANIGNHSLYFKSYFKKILAFEPNSNAYELLNLNCKHYKNIKTFNYGLGEKNKKIILFENPNNIGGTSVFYGKDDELPKIKSKIVRLDDLKINNIGLIKLDVEGYEYQVLQGGLNTLLSNKPIIIFELLKKMKYKKELINLMNNLNYEIYFFYRKEYVNFLFFKFINKFIELFFGRVYCLKKISFPISKDFSMLIGLPKG